MKESAGAKTLGGEGLLSKEVETVMKKKTDRFEQELLHLAEQEKMIVPETVYRKVDDTLVSLSAGPIRKKMTWKKAVLLAAVLTAMCSVTVTAAVGALQRRMEAMNQKEIADYFVQIYTSKLGADNYNRPMKEEERNRMAQLRVSYEQEAVFPQKALTMLSSPDAYKGKGVGFYKETSTFFLPEKDMSDEELLQIIDFVHRRDYSLQVMKDKITESETSFLIEEITEDEGKEEKEKTGEEAVQRIPYTGNLPIRKIAAGQDCIYLTGKNSIHRMEIGSSDSERYFDDFENDTYVNAMYEDKKGNLYLAVNERIEEGGDVEKDGLAQGENAGNGSAGVVTIAGEKYRSALWILNRTKEVVRKIDLSSGQAQAYEGIGMVTQLVVDAQGYIYLRGTGIGDALLLVLDGQGDYVKRITSDLYDCHALGGLGVGRDGRIYTQIQDRDRMGIASVDLAEGALDEIYMDIVPEGTIMLDLIAPGSDTDFVFWGYDGIFTYDLGAESAVNILPAYEAPCDWEGVMYCALPDGRIVFADAAQYRQEGTEMQSIPEQICFYYVPGR
ncbi:MAG: hypothetical protein K1W10_00455 [Lachnospiraceae bacterium]